MKAQVAWALQAQMLRSRHTFLCAEGEAIKVYVRQPRHLRNLSRRRCTSSAGGEANRGNLSIKDRDGAQHSVDAIDSQLRKIEGQSLGYKVARFFGLLGR